MDQLLHLAQRLRIVCRPTGEPDSARSLPAGSRLADRRDSGSCRVRPAAGGWSCCPYPLRRRPDRRGYFCRRSQHRHSRHRSSRRPAVGLSRLSPLCPDFVRAVHSAQVVPVCPGCPVCPSLSAPVKLPDLAPLPVLAVLSVLSRLGHFVRRAPLALLPIRSSRPFGPMACS